MCGIAGIFKFNFGSTSKEYLNSMLAALSHRGPNHKGIFVDQNVALGHVRLSILDLTEYGHQPMFSHDNRYCIVYNGEVFNYLELRNELSRKYNFKTNTDTEVILAAYQEWGDKCLNKFNGMWAFAIYDSVEKSIFISRDRYGEKPLYYYYDECTFVFASEIKALFRVLKSRLTPDYNSIYEYLVYGRTDQSCNTFISEVKRLQHGCTIKITNENVAFNQWYNLKENLFNPWQSPEEYRDCFSSAVNLRLRSDVPVGVCLSGGLDSSAVTSTILKDFAREDIFAFSAVYGAGKHGDESSYIDLYKQNIKNLVRIYPTEETFTNDLSDFLECHFEPVPTLSIYSQYKVIKEASRYITVGLDGQGADEQLGGYHYFFASYFLGLIRQREYGKLLSEMSAYFVQHKSILAFKYLGYYLLPLESKKRAIIRKVSGLSQTFIDMYSSKSKIDELLFSPRSLKDSLLEHFDYKLEHNLKWNDLNSMWFSVELRAPFMDFRLVERTLASNEDQIISDGYTKSILRKAMKLTLPEQIRLRQDKVGFENPAEEWMRTASIKELAEETLSSSFFKDSGLFDVKKCRERFKLHQEGKLSISSDIWKWINIIYFLQKFN